MMVTAIRGDPNWRISYLQTSFMYRLKERERERELGRNPRRKGEREREKGGRQGFEGESARALTQTTAAAAAAFLEGRPEGLYHGAHSSLLPSLSSWTFPLPLPAVGFPSSAGQKDELLGKEEIGLRWSTWSECTMLEVVLLL